MTKLHRTVCERCGEKVVHAKTGTSNWISVNPKRDPAGPIVFLSGRAIFDHSGHLEPRFTPHSSTCKHPVRHASIVTRLDDDDTPVSPVRHQDVSDSHDVFGLGDDDSRSEAPPEVSTDASGHTSGKPEPRRR